MKAILNSSVSVLHGHSLGDVLRRTAVRLADKTAIVCGQVTWTYRDFDSICNRLANGLISRGIAPGDRVAVLSRNSHLFAALRFALARIGAVLVPVNFMLNAEEIAFILRSSGAKALALSADFVEVGRAASARVPEVRQLYWLQSDDASVAPAPQMAAFDEMLSDSAEAPQVGVDARMLAQIVYTSGTESSPKGVMLTHEAILWEYVSCIVDAEIAENDIILHALPMYHCAQLDCFFGPGIYVGTTNVIIGQPRADVVLPLIAQQRINSFFAPPSVWIQLLRSPAFDSTDLSSLQKSYYGASIMPVEVLMEMQRRLPGVRLWNLYGQTEIAPVATILKPADQLRKAGSAGKPVLNVETRVVNDAMEDVARGEIGEIVHRSPQLLTGYFNDPEKTEAAFEGTWFHSGDLGVLDEEGYLFVVDRKKDMIKSGGENVASREVEEAIFRIAQVSEVAAIGLPDPYWIEAVTAIVVLKEGRSLGAEEVIAHCRKELAVFKVPKRVIFAESLPKSPSGKVLKRELRHLYEGKDA